MTFLDFVLKFTYMYLVNLAHVLEFVKHAPGTRDVLEDSSFLDLN